MGYGLKFNIHSKQKVGSKQKSKIHSIYKVHLTLLQLNHNV
jgi:hypothetical protein